MFSRILNLNESDNESVFLWGARQTLFGLTSFWMMWAGTPPIAMRPVDRAIRRPEHLVA